MRQLIRTSLVVVKGGVKGLTYGYWFHFRLNKSSREDETTHKMSKTYRSQYTVSFMTVDDNPTFIKTYPHPFSLE